MTKMKSLTWKDCKIKMKINRKKIDMVRMIKRNKMRINLNLSKRTAR